jgi:uncharacterized protein YciI
MSDPVLHHCLFYDYVENIADRRTPYRAGHLAHIADWNDDGRIVIAGALGTPPHGGLFVFRIDDPAQIEDFVAADPYVAAGLVTGHRVVPWTVVTR